MASVIIAQPSGPLPDADVTDAAMMNITVIWPHRHLPDGCGPAETRAMTTDTAIRPFRIHIPQADPDDLMGRLARKVFLS